MIILEGCDCVGKSYLAKELQRCLGFDIIKENYHEDGWEHYVKLARRLELCAPVIYDRFHLSEMVYPVIREDGRKPMLRWQQHMVERLLMGKGCLLVNCATDIATIEGNFRAKKEEFISEKQIPKTLELYDDAVKHSLLPHYSYNMIYDFDIQVQDIIKVYRKVIHGTDTIVGTKFNHFGGNGQNAKGNILLVGVKHSAGLGPNQFDYAAFGLYGGGYDLFLHQALQLTGLAHHFRLTNAVKFKNKQTDLILLQEEYLLYQPKVVIALGDTASAYLYMLGIKHKSFTPPSQYGLIVKETAHEYAKRLKALCESL